MVIRTLEFAHIVRLRLGVGMVFQNLELRSEEETHVLSSNHFTLQAPKGLKGILYTHRLLCIPT